MPGNYWSDSDGVGFGDADGTFDVCPQGGLVDNSDDGDDNDALVSPAQFEVPYNGVDDDCDSSVDEDYLSDESCFQPGACSAGNAGSTCDTGTETACAPGLPSGVSEALCNGVDDDCDGSIGGASWTGGV